MVLHLALRQNAITLADEIVVVLGSDEEALPTRLALIVKENFVIVGEERRQRGILWSY